MPVHIVKPHLHKHICLASQSQLCQKVCPPQERIQQQKVSLEMMPNSKLYTAACGVDMLNPSRERTATIFLEEEDLAVSCMGHRPSVDYAVGPKTSLHLDQQS